MPLRNEIKNNISYFRIAGDITGQSSSVGVPRARKIVFNWSMSVSPGRYGMRSMSSASIVPTDQMSTAEL